MANLVYRFKGPEGTFQKSTAEAVILAETGETVTPAINLAGSSMVLSIADTVGDDSINAVIREYFGDIDYAEGQEQTTDEASVGGSKYYFGNGAGWLDEDGLHIVEDGQITLGDAILMNNFSIIRNGLNFFDRYNATYGDVSRRGETGLFLPTGGSTPAFYIWFGDPTENTNLQEDGDIELGTLEKFDAADSGTPSWSADSGGPYEGEYAALLTTTDDADGSEVQTNGDFETGDFTGWVSAGTATRAVTNTPVLLAGSYSYIITGTANQTSTLTTDLGTPDRMAVTAGLYYRFEAICYGNAAAWGTFKVDIKWYTLTSGGVLVDTSTINVTPTTSGVRVNGTFLAPATAAGAEIVITCNRDADAGAFVAAWDSVSFKAAQYGTLTTNLGGTPLMAVTAGEAYQLSLYAQTDVSGSGVWEVVKAEINWYDDTSGTTLIDTDTVPISLSTSYANVAVPFVCPVGAAGAELVITAVRDSTTNYDAVALARFDNISLRLLTVSRYIKFLPNVTIEGGPLDFALMGAAASTPASGIESVYGLSADKNLFAKDSTGRINVLTPFQAVATPNSDANVDFQNIPQTGHDLHITGVLRPETDDVALFLRINNYSGASDYSWNVSGSDPDNDTADSEIHIISGTTAGSGVGNAAGEGIAFDIWIKDYAAVIGSMNRRASAVSVWQRANASTLSTTAGGTLVHAEAVTRITLLFESGDIAEGSVRYYIK